MMRSWAVWEPSRSPLAALLKPPDSLDARQKDPKRDSRLPNKTSHIKPLCMTGRWGAYKPRWGPSLGGARGAPLMPPPESPAWRRVRHPLPMSTDAVVSLHASLEQLISVVPSEICFWRPWATISAIPWRPRVPQKPSRRYSARHSLA